MSEPDLGQQPPVPADMLQWLYPGIRQGTGHVTAVLADHAGHPVWTCPHAGHHRSEEALTCAAAERNQRYADAAGLAGPAGDAELIGWTLCLARRRAGGSLVIRSAADVAAVLGDAKAALRERGRDHILAAVTVRAVPPGPGGLQVGIDMPGGRGFRAPHTSVLSFTEGLPAQMVPAWPTRCCVPAVMTRLIRIARALRDAVPPPGLPGPRGQVLHSETVLYAVRSRRLSSPGTGRRPAVPAWP